MPRPRVTGAPCTSDGRARSETLTVTVPGPEEETSGTPLTARIDDFPAEHDGLSGFPVRIAFSSPITASQNKFPQAFDVENGRIASARREGGRSDLWTLTVVPGGVEAVRIVLRGNRPCGSGGVPCATTPDGNGRIRLSNTVSIEIRGPAAISIADAEATEGTDANMAFQVTLDRVALKTITVDYETRDGTATAGADYTATSGTLTFTVGHPDLAEFRLPGHEHGPGPCPNSDFISLRSGLGPKVPSGAEGSQRRSDYRKYLYSEPLAKF